jgi:penicillin-binding protein A
MRRSVPLAVLSIASFAIGVSVGTSGTESANVGRFVEAWKAEDHEAMHAELSTVSQKEHSAEELERLYGAAMATATGIGLETGEVREENDTAVFTATVDTLAFGDVEGEMRIPLDEAGAVLWKPHLVFPGLVEGEELGRVTRVGARAALLAADGSPLAEGPAGARTSPLGESALAIAGAVGPPSVTQDKEQFALGFARGSATGTSGLELAFNAQLAGQPSGQLFATDADGQQRILAEAQPTPGQPVKTTIDPEVQEATVLALGGQYGGVTVLDAETGDVLGVAGLGFSAPQPPGSTFKIITATAALDAGVVSLDDVFPIEVSNSDIGREISNAGDAACGGTFVRSFAESCNTVFAPLGVEVGIEKMVETAEAFGFGSVPSLAAPGPLAALSPPAPSLGEVESDVALGEMSIGQGQVLSTPLGMASVAQTIANDGVRLPNSIVATEELRPADKPVTVTSEETADKVESMMLEVVRSGTSVAAQVPGIEIAGKSGTAELGPKALQPGQILAPGEEPPQDENAWFTAFAPAKQPKYAVAVMLISTPGGGGTVAAPIARDIFAALLTK